MKILIDTNILLLILFDDEKLTKNELKIIEDENNEIIITGISIFEISLKYSIGKLKLKNVKPEDIPEIVEKNGYIMENTDYKTFSTFYKLTINKPIAALPQPNLFSFAYFSFNKRKVSSFSFCFFFFY